MTKKHFQFIADTLNTLPTFNATLRAQKLSAVKTFADALAKEYPKFDRDIFLQACGVYYMVS